MFIENNPGEWKAIWWQGYPFNEKSCHKKRTITEILKKGEREHSHWIVSPVKI